MGVKHIINDRKWYVKQLLSSDLIKKLWACTSTQSFFSSFLAHGDTLGHVWVQPWFGKHVSNKLWTKHFNYIEETT